MSTPQDQLSSPAVVSGEVHREQALELRKTGMPYRAIAKRLGLSVSTVHEHVQIALADLRETSREKAAEVQALELDRLDAIHEAHWGKIAEPTHANVILRTMQRRADLLGLDAPKNIKIGGDGTAVQHALGPDLSKLSVEQLLELERILAAATPSAVPAIPPSTSTAAPLEG